MKIQLVLFSFIALTLFADMFEGNEVSFDYDIEMNRDESITKYFVDTSNYDKYLPEVLGVYIIYGGIPISITKDLRRMNEILNHYIDLKEGSFQPKIKSLKNSEMENLKKSRK